MAVCACVSFCDFSGKLLEVSSMSPPTLSTVLENWPSKLFENLQKSVRKWTLAAGNIETYQQLIPEQSPKKEGPFLIHAKYDKHEWLFFTGGDTHNNFPSYFGGFCSRVGDPSVIFQTIHVYMYHFTETVGGGGGEESNREKRTSVCMYVVFYCLLASSFGFPCFNSSTLFRFNHKFWRGPRLSC